MRLALLLAAFVALALVFTRSDGVEVIHATPARTEEGSSSEDTRREAVGARQEVVPRRASETRPEIEPPQPTTLSLSVSALLPGDDKEPAAGLQIRVGVGWSRAEGPPAEDELPDVDDCLQRRELAQGRTDVEGRLGLELLVPGGVPWDRVWAEVVEPGHQRWVATRERRESGSYAVTLRAHRGWTLRAVAHAWNGEVCQSASLFLPEFVRDHGKSEGCGPRGVFGRHLSNSAGGALLHVRDAARGLLVTRLPGADWDPDQLMRYDLPEVGDVLAGVVRDPEGRPVEAGRVVVFPSGGSPGLATLLGLEERARLEADGLLVFGEAPLGAGGRFRLAGLAPGDYDLALRPRRGMKRVPLNADPIAVGSEGLELVAPIHRVLVRVDDPIGEIDVPWVRPDLRELERTALFLLGREELENARYPTTPEFTRRNEGLEFVLTPDRYSVACMDAYRTPVAREFVVGPEDWYQEIDLVLGERAAPGTLQIVMEGEGVEDFQTGELAIRFPGKDLELAREHISLFRERRITVTVPPGTYDIELDGGMHWSSCGVDSMGRWDGRFLTENVQVRPGETVVLQGVDDSQ